MSAVDLSRPIVPGMPVWPGDPAVEAAPACTVEGDGCSVTRLTLGTHTGTHLDAPAHLVSGGRALDTLPLEAFFGTAAVVRGFPSLDALEALSGVDFLLFSTGWASQWGKPGYFSRYPVPTPALLEQIIHMGVRGLGMDTPSPDAPDSLEHHRLLLGAGLVVVENLCNLCKLEGRRVWFTALPLPLAGADGAPVRAIALPLEEEDA